MAHNHLMNNQHVMMNSNPTITSPGSSAQPAVSSQGLNAPKSVYSLQSSLMSQNSHLQQQQPQILHVYHNGKQMSSSDIPPQFTSNVDSLPSQNGNAYQTMTGNSFHSNMMDNSQLNMHQQSQSSSSSHQYQHHQQHPQQQMHTSVQNQTQHYSATAMSLGQHQLHHQQHQQHQEQQQQPQHVHHYLSQQHSSQLSSTQQSQLSKQSQQQHHQQSLQQQQQLQQHQHNQIQQHLQQRSLQQQQRYQKLQQQQQYQPKQILQNVISQGLVDGSFEEKDSSQPGSLEETKLVKPVGERNGVAHTQNSGDEGEKSVIEDTKNINDESKDNASENSSLANTKEKTPMCLINELARYNKTEHQYTLLDEQGPAHKKTFFVKLKLGEEEYSASGESIKKAQHAAAAIALTETKYKHPSPKPARTMGINVVDADGNITPTVELNALAMKRGEAAVYKAIEPQQPPYYHQQGMDYRGVYNQRYQHYMRTNRDPRYRGFWPLRYHYPRVNRAFYVSLRVGHREFIGDGPTRQAARHNAAQKALRILNNLPIQTPSKQLEEEVEEENNGDILKSEISLVHEIALRRNMVVNFEVIQEAGPAHMKNFLTCCTVADMVTEGDGNSKKLSKKRAAELMLEELKKLPPLPAVTYVRPKAKVQVNKKKNRNIIKSEIQQQKADPNYGVGINPISRLIQIMQAQKRKEPVYTLVAERGMPRRREFIMQVEVEDKTCTGSGPNKKLAKRSAAEAMLQELGYTKPSPQPTKSSIKNASSSESGSGNGDKKVTFVDTSQSGDGEKSSTSSASSVSHQRVPGLLHLPSKMVVSTPGMNLSASKEPLVNLSSILKPNWRPEIQLKELCKVFDYQLEIDDFTKKCPNSTEYISRISIGAENPQNFHGSSNTVESARDIAAMDALKVLVARVKDVHPGGDGPQVKKTVLTRSTVGLRQDTTK